MQQGTGPAEYYQYLQNNPRVDDYAEFRSAGEKLQAAWQYWPAPQKDGVLSPSDYNEGVKQYYLYAQWLLESQLKALTEKARKRDMRLYFDLPLGVSPQSYDVWRERESFVSGISAGAPPDGFFTRGQQWELSPLHPQGLRRQGYKYYIECLRHNFKYAGILRIDHIMSFHRLYVIPEGFEATQGAYIRYPCDEFYAIVTLESSRASCLVLGEDLGTVPTEVRKMMQRHQLYRHYVVQYEIAPTTPPLPDVPQKVIASINTHDMPTFTSFWQGNDVQERYNRGLLDNEGVAIEIKNRQLIRDKVINYLSGKGFINSRSPGTHEVLRGLLAFLSSSRAWAVMVNLEDLWGETQAQNVPGTLDEKLNYCRMLRYIFEEFTNMPQVVEALQDVSDKRRGGNV